MDRLGLGQEIPHYSAKFKPNLNYLNIIDQNVTK